MWACVCFSKDSKDTNSVLPRQVCIRCRQTPCWHQRTLPVRCRALRASVCRASRSTRPETRQFPTAFPSVGSLFSPTRRVEARPRYGVWKCRNIDGAAGNQDQKTSRLPREARSERGGNQIRSIEHGPARRMCSQTTEFLLLKCDAQPPAPSELTRSSPRKWFCIHRRLVPVVGKLHLL